MTGAPHPVLDPLAVWCVLPARMPGMLPGTVALRFPGVNVPQVMAALEGLVASGNVVRVVRRGHDVYYRGVALSVASRGDGGVEQLGLFEGVIRDGSDRG